VLRGRGAMKYEKECSRSPSPMNHPTSALISPRSSPLPLPPPLLNSPPYPPDQNPALLYLASLAPGSRRTMAEALRSAALILAPGVPFDAFPWTQLRRPHAAALRSRWQDTSAPATANKRLAALRGVVREACLLGLMTHEQGASILALKGVRGARVPAGRALAPEELTALFAQCARPTPGAARDTALLALGYGAGLRRAEIVSLDVDDYSRSDACVLVRGKGNRQRRVPLPPGADTALAHWLDVRGSEPGPLLWPLRKNGQLAPPRRLTEQAVYHLLRRLAPRANIAPLSPHDLRRSFIGDLLDRGADLATVQRLVGHQSPLTTARYDRRGELAKQRAVALLPVPTASTTAEPPRPTPRGTPPGTRLP
jgi:site-specific recombinase XerD